MVSLCRLKQCFSLHNDTTPPQPNHTVTPTHIEPEQCNPWDKSTIIRKLLKMDVLTFETCWAVNSEIIKKWHQLVYLYSTIKKMHGPINIRWTGLCSLSTVLFYFTIRYIHTYIYKCVYMNIWLGLIYWRVGSEDVNKHTEYIKQGTWQKCTENGPFYYKCRLYRLASWIYLGKPREKKETSVTHQKPTEQNC